MCRLGPPANRLSSRKIQFGSDLPVSKQAKGAYREHQAPSRSPHMARTGR